MKNELWKYKYISLYWLVILHYVNWRWAAFIAQNNNNESNLNYERDTFHDTISHNVWEETQYHDEGVRNKQSGLMHNVRGRNNTH